MLAVYDAWTTRRLSRLCKLIKTVNLHHKDFKPEAVPNLKYISLCCELKQVVALSTKLVAALFTNHGSLSKASHYTTVQANEQKICSCAAHANHQQPVLTLVQKSMINPVCMSIFFFLEQDCRSDIFV